MSRRALTLATARHAEVMAELADIADAIEAIAGREAPVDPGFDVQTELRDQQLENARLTGLNRDLQGKLRNADEMVVSLLARAESADASVAQLTEERQNLAAQIADQAETLKRVSYPLAVGVDHAPSQDLQEAKAALHDQQLDNARLAGLNRDLEGKLRNADEMVVGLLARAESAEVSVAALQADLKAARAPKSEIVLPAPTVAPQSAGRAIHLTPLAEQVGVLIGKGHNDASIRTIVNNYLAPEDWLNAGGVKALRAILQGAS